MARSKAGEIFVDLILNTDQFDKASRGTVLNLHQVGKAFDRLNGVINNVAMGGLNTLARGLSAFGKSTVKVGAGFEQTMSSIGAVTRATTEDMVTLEQHARRLGATTAFTATQAAEAMLELSKAGLNATQVVQASSGILKLAGATGTAFAATSRSIVSAIKQFNLGFAQTERVVDVFAEATSKSLLDMHSLTEAMKFGGIAGASFGMSLEDTVAALAALRNIGLEGSLAGTNFRMAMAQAAVATSKETEMLATFKLTLEDVSPEFNTFADILETVGKKGLGATEGMMVFGRRAGAQMIQLARQTIDSRKTLEEAQQALSDDYTTANKEALEEAKANLVDIEAFSKGLQNDSYGRAGEMYDKFLDNVQGQTTILLSKVQDVQLTAFDSVKAGLQRFIEDMQKRVDMFGAILADESAQIDIAMRSLFEELLYFVDQNSGAILELFRSFLYVVVNLIPRLGFLLEQLVDLFRLIVKVFLVSRVVAFMTQIFMLTRAVVGLAVAFEGVAAAANLASLSAKGVGRAMGVIGLALTALYTAYQYFFSDVIDGFSDITKAALSSSEIMTGSTEEMLVKTRGQYVEIGERQAEIQIADLARATELAGMRGEGGVDSLSRQLALYGERNYDLLGEDAAGYDKRQAFRGVGRGAFSTAGAAAPGKGLSDMVNTAVHQRIMEIEDQRGEAARRSTANIYAAAHDKELLPEITPEGQKEMVAYGVALRKLQANLAVLGPAFRKAVEELDIDADDDVQADALEQGSKAYQEALSDVDKQLVAVGMSEYKRAEFMERLRSQMGYVSASERERIANSEKMARIKGNEYMLEERKSEALEHQQMIQSHQARQETISAEAQERARIGVARGLAEQEEKTSKLAAAKLRLKEATEKLSRSIQKSTKDQVRSMQATIEDNDAVDESIAAVDRLVDRLKEKQDKELADFKATQSTKIKTMKIKNSERIVLQKQLDAALVKIEGEHTAARNAVQLAAEQKSAAEILQIYEDQLEAIENTYMSQVDSREVELIKIRRLEEKFLEEVALARKAAAKSGTALTEEMEAYIKATEKAIAVQKKLANMTDAERQRFDFFSKLIDDRSKKLKIFLQYLAPLFVATALPIAAGGVNVLGAMSPKDGEGGSKEAEALRKKIEASLGSPEAAEAAVAGKIQKVGELTADKLLDDWHDVIKKGSENQVRSALNWLLKKGWLTALLASAFAGSGSADDMRNAILGSLPLAIKSTPEGSHTREQKILFDALNRGYSEFAGLLHQYTTRDEEGKPTGDLQSAKGKGKSEIENTSIDFWLARIDALEKMFPDDSFLAGGSIGIRAATAKDAVDRKWWEKGLAQILKGLAATGSGQGWWGGDSIQGLLLGLAGVSTLLGQAIGLGEGLGERGDIATGISKGFAEWANVKEKGTPNLAAGQTGYIAPANARMAKYTSGIFKKLGVDLKEGSDGLSVMFSKIGPVALAFGALAFVGTKVVKSFIGAMKGLVEISYKFLDRLTSIVFGTSIKGLVGLAGKGMTGEEGEEKGPVELLGEKLDEFKERISNIRRFLPAVVKTVVDGLVQAAPMLFGAIAQLVPTILAILGNNAGPLVSAIGNGIAQVMSRLPGVADFLVSMLEKAAKKAPAIIKKIFTSIVGLVARLPSLMERAMEAVFGTLMELARGITGPQMTKFFLGATKVVSNIVALIFKGLAMGVDILMEMLPEFTEALVILLGGRAFQAALIEAGVSIVGSILRIVASIIIGLVKMVVQLIIGIPRIVGTIITVWTEAVRQAFQQMVDGLIEAWERITSPGQSFKEWRQDKAEGNAPLDWKDVAIQGGMGILGALAGAFLTGSFKGMGAGAALGSAAGSGINEWRERKYGDTPSVLRATGGLVRFAPGDYFAAARNPADLMKQAVESFARSGGGARINAPAMQFGFDQMASSMMNMATAPGGAMQPTFTSVTVKAEGQVLDSVLVRAQRKGHAPEMSRLLRKNSSVRIGLDRGKFAPQSG